MQTCDPRPASRSRTSRRLPLSPRSRVVRYARPGKSVQRAKKRLTIYWWNIECVSQRNSLSSPAKKCSSAFISTGLSEGERKGDVCSASSDNTSLLIPMCEEYESGKTDCFPVKHDDVAWASTSGIARSRIPRKIQGSIVTNISRRIAGRSLGCAYFSPFFSLFPRSGSKVLFPRERTPREGSCRRATNATSSRTKHSDDILAGPQIGSLDNPRAGGWLI